MPARRPGNVSVSVSGGGVRLEWDTRRTVDELRDVHQEAMDRVKQRAQRYWDVEEWTTARHPYMTGNEESIQERGFMDLAVNPDGTIKLTVGSDSEHTVFEELGTSRQAAHHPIRNTVDKVAYTISDELRAAARRHGFNA